MLWVLYRPLLAGPVMLMDERSLIYDWNTVEYELNRNPANHPHGFGLMMKLTGWITKPSARNPTIVKR